MATPPPDFNAIGQAFAGQYYQMFAGNRASLSAMYQGDSMLTWEDTMVQGQANIMTHLQEGLKFGSVQHRVTKVDCQPTGPFEGTGWSILVSCMGMLQHDPNEPPLPFSQVFVLKANGGGWSVGVFAIV